MEDGYMKKMHPKLMALKALADELLAMCDGDIAEEPVKSVQDLKDKAYKMDKDDKKESK